MVCGTSNIPEALACRATQDQENITKHQVEIIRKFLTIGNQNEDVREYVLRRTQQEPEAWDQVLIFLALSSFRPVHTKLEPPTNIDELWHEYLICSREYANLCMRAAGRHIHHVPDALSSGPAREPWFENLTRMTSFLDNQIEEYDEDLWGATPEDYEIMTRESFETYRDFYIQHHGIITERCDGCDSRCSE